MQKSVIFFKQSLPEKVVTLLVSIANEAFNNREGQILSLIHISEPTRPY